MSVLQTTEITCRKGLNAIYSGAPLPCCVFPRYNDEFVPPSSNPGPHDWNTSSRGPAPTFFGTLPYDVLSNILRQSSACPRKKDWHKFLNLKDVQNFFSGKSPLQYVAENVLRRLLIGHDEVRPVGPGCVMVPRDAGAELVHEAVDSMAKLLEQLYVRHLPIDADFLLSVANKCRALTQLAVKQAAPDHLLRYIFESRGHQLTRLSLNHVSTDISDVIAARCRVLRYVNIQRPPGSLDALWKSAGKTLELVMLYFQTREHETSCLESVKLNCWNLNSVYIVLSKNTFSHAMYAGLLALCGRRLRKACLGSMPPELCKRLAAACPKARFYVNGRGALSLQMEALGPTLEIMHCRSELDPLKMAADGCRNLREISLKPKRSCTVKIMKALFSAPKLSLNTLRIGHTTGYCHEMLAVVAKGTGSLRELFCVVDVYEKFSFLSLAKANLGLRTVRVQVVEKGRRRINPFPYGKAERIIVDLLMCFKLCPHIEEIVVWALPAPHKYLPIWRDNWGSRSSAIDEAPTFPSVANACCVFRGQRTYVRVFGTDYLS